MRRLILLAVVAAAMTTMMGAGAAFAQTGGGGTCHGQVLPSGDIMTECGQGFGGHILDGGFGIGRGFHQTADIDEESGAAVELTRQGGGGSGGSLDFLEPGGEGGRCVIAEGDFECTPNAPEDFEP